ncbi:pentraxin-related protein PTX3 [Marmota marmota marmota]|uniref:pentraxin-related protein PTX3 n=1 Tax=Marmota marmota marmota TaxID=9994 RepID=UPI0020929999|nr:pentraxin-related protein PTX3 [Marmota marmota marmota]
MHLPVVLLCAVCAAALAENSDDYDLMYVNMENEIFNGLHPTEDRKFLSTFSANPNYLSRSFWLAALGCETALLFPMRSKKIFGSVHPVRPMTLESLSVCIWVKATEVQNKTVLFSYGTKRSPYEIQLYLSPGSTAFVVGGEENTLVADTAVSPGRWTHLCGTWTSADGRASLWVDGELVAAAAGKARGHVVPEGGALQLGQEKNGCCAGGFDEARAFAGRVTALNLWDRALRPEEVAEAAGPESCSRRGKVVGWGVTEVQPHGGAQYVS